MWLQGFCLKGIPMWNHYGLWCDFMWRDNMTSHNMHNEFVFVSQSIAKKRTFGQKDCTIWETREVRERSGVFITFIWPLLMHHHNIDKFHLDLCIWSNIDIDKDTWVRNESNWFINWHSYTQTIWTKWFSLFLSALWRDKLVLLIFCSERKLSKWWRHVQWGVGPTINSCFCFTPQSACHFLNASFWKLFHWIWLMSYFSCKSVCCLIDKLESYGSPKLSQSLGLLKDLSVLGSYASVIRFGALPAPFRWTVVSLKGIGM